MGVAACSSATADTAANTGGEYRTSGEVVTEVVKDEAAFKNSDLKDVTEEDVNATITLSGNSGTISDTALGSSGQTVTVTKKGEYKVVGSSHNATIVIDDVDKSGNVYLVFDGVTMTNAQNACVYVKSADKAIIQVVGDNSFTSTMTEAATDGTTSVDGAIFSKDDLTINGTGTLAVNSSLHGIVCKDDLKITGATVSVTADEKGLDANDSVRIGGGVVSVTSGHDGVQVENDAGDGYFYMDGGSLTVISGYDAIDVGGTSSYVSVAGGTLNLTAGGGSNKSKNSSVSQKGVKCDGDIRIGDSAVTVSSADDCIHSGATVSVTAGKLTLSSSDDGVHADSSLSVSGGELTVTKSYEGLEAFIVDVSGGTLNVAASDDGINAAGDTGDSSTRQSPWSNSSSTGTLRISGGNIYVNCSGDGLDSNGSLYVSGGYTIVEGPTNGGNGALDKGDGNGCVASITGGVVLALGTTDMAVNFDSGNQCSALVSVSGGKGTVITVDDGSGFSFTASKSFACAVYSSPNMKKGNSYTLNAGSAAVTLNFASSCYYSTVSGMGGPGGMGRPGGMGGGPSGGFTRR